MLHDPDFEKLVDSIRPQIKEYSVTEVVKKFELNDNFIFIDVREDNEWNTSRIPRSIHLGRGVIERDIANTVKDKQQEIILYCGGGFRSALAAYNLQQMGYTNVASMDGGIREWKALNLPIET